MAKRRRRITVRAVTVVTNLPGTDRVRIETGLPNPLGEGPLIMEFQAPAQGGLDYVREHVAGFLEDQVVDLVDSALGERRVVKL